MDTESTHSWIDQDGHRTGLVTHPEGVQKIVVGGVDDDDGDAVDVEDGGEEIL